MNINKLEIKGFGRINNLTINFNKGLNIIFGDNESGKSTVQLFIKAMLFGLKGGRTGRDGTLPPLKRFKPWNGSEYNGFMEYSLDDGQVYRVGRNFSSGSVRIFDSFFNDITDTFDSTRERGALFAEKHLMLNEACFEKTVFIGQLDSKVDADGSKELINRLTNASQTGFEDMSLKRAEEALCEALKNNVGTGKTSTKPLDRIISRLNELGEYKNAMLGRRNTLLGTFAELNKAVGMKEQLQKRKHILARCREIVETRKNIVKLGKQAGELEELLAGIRQAESGLEAALRHADEINAERNKYFRFSSYSIEDADSIGLDYVKLTNLASKNKKLSADSTKKKDEKTAIIHSPELTGAFADTENGFEENVLQLVRNIENLKAEHENLNVEGLNSSVNALRQKNKRLNTGIAAMCILSAAGFLCGLAGVPSDAFKYVDWIAGAALLAGAAALLLLKMRTSRNLGELIGRKRVSFISGSTITDELDKKQRQLDEMFKKAGIRNLEDFYSQKASYNTKAQLLSSLEGDICELEDEYASVNRDISVLRNSILERLLPAGIIESSQADVTEELVNSFKCSIRRYRELEPEVVYTSKRIEDLGNSLKELNRRAALICGEDSCGGECLAEALNEARGNIARLEDRLDEIAAGISSLCADGGLNRQDTDELHDKYLKGNPDTIGGELDKETAGVDEKLVSANLKIKECETLQKSLACDDEELQTVEEEIEELEAKKAALESMGASLKKALDVLSEAGMEIQRDFAPALNSRMGDIINRISSGRYSDLRADDKLLLKTVAPETGSVVTVSELSGGTIDQIYLAMRMAMAGLVTGEREKLPFAMDEVFAQYDDSRMKETFRYLDEISSGRQIIFFTCKGREVETAAEVFGSRLNLITLKG